jgi:hypothetical protein
MLTDFKLIIGHGSQHQLNATLLRDLSLRLRYACHVAQGHDCFFWI